MILFFLSSFSLVGSADFCLFGTVFNGIVLALFSSLLMEFLRASA
jgi:hypothetical protein